MAIIAIIVSHLVSVTSSKWEKKCQNWDNTVSERKKNYI